MSNVKIGLGLLTCVVHSARSMVLHSSLMLKRAGVWWRSWRNSTRASCRTPGGCWPRA